MIIHQFNIHLLSFYFASGHCYRSQRRQTSSLRGIRCLQARNQQWPYNLGGKYLTNVWKSTHSKTSDFYPCCLFRPWKIIPVTVFHSQLDRNPVFTVILSTKDLTSLSPCSLQPICQHSLLLLHPLTPSHYGLAAGDIAVISQTGFPCSTFVLLSSRLVVFLKLKLYYAADTV